MHKLGSLAQLGLVIVACGVLVVPRAALAQATDVASRVEALFRQKCADCHGSDLPKPKGGFKGVEDLAKLRANPKYIKRFDPENSLLYQYLSGAQTPQMPKGDDPLTAEELALVREWIGVGSAMGEKTADSTDRKLLSEEDVIKLVHADALRNESEDRLFLRYFSLANIWNEQIPATASAAERAKFDHEVRTTIEVGRVALAKLLNSLSWSVSLVQPKRIDADGLIWRIDLRDFTGNYGAKAWGDSEWQMICDRYPYGRRIGGKEEDELVEWLGTELVVVRADWFAFAASRPPLYHDLLGLPGSDGGHGADLVLEKELGVDVSANILARRNVARAGIRDKQSGVSQHNRLIERHERRTGHYYWKSYDFQDSVGPSNLVLRPLGPSSVELPANQIDFVFSHAGGEIIFDLPNGLQGYLLVDADGRRLDDGPAKIVYDRDNSAEVVGQITNGISCIACHAGGINPKLDQIRDGALKVLPRTLRDEFEALYPPNDAMARLQESDRARFRAAMRKIDPNHACDDSLCEPVRQMSVRFLENLTFERAAAEFGVEPKAFEVAFGGRGRASFTQLSAGAMSRAEFVRVFKDIVADNASEFGEVSGCGSAAEIPVSPASPKSTTDTRPRPSPTKAIWNANWDAEVVRQDPDPAVVTDAAGRARMIATRLPWKVRDRKTGIVMLLCPPGEFVMGSPVDEQGRGSNERQREVSIEQAFYLSEAEVTQAQWARVMEKNPSRGEGLGNPVNSVFWSECQSFCQLSGLRLPSEVEWEFACRAGTTGAYAGDLKSMGWFNDGSGGAKEHPVKQKLPNPWGFYDMHGNVIEWCQDTYDLNAVGTQAAASANSPAHVIRGGGWFQRSDECRSASRDSYSDRRREVMFGFRVARTPG